MASMPWRATRRARRPTGQRGQPSPQKSVRCATAAHCELLYFGNKDLNDFEGVLAFWKYSSRWPSGGCGVETLGLAALIKLFGAPHA